MSKKCFIVDVEVNIQSITCPGVCLCTNGKVSLQLFMLDSYIQTNSSKPIFPIVCKEKYVFHKIFHKDSRLGELQRSLCNEWLYAEFIQWQNCEVGCVLATFQTTLNDLLYPSSLQRCIAGIDLELLMEPTKLFPGTIAPKIQITTKTSINETVCDFKDVDNIAVVNPKLLQSMQPPKRVGQMRKVCHSIAYSRAKKAHSYYNGKPSKPQFLYRRAEDDLIIRTNPNVVLKSKPYSSTNISDDFARKRYRNVTSTTLFPERCYCCKRSKSLENKLAHSKSFRSTSPVLTKTSFTNDHKENICPTCSKYNVYFSPSETTELQQATRIEPTKFCSCCKQCGNCRIKSRDVSPYHISDVSEKRICFCLPPPQHIPGLAKELHKKLSKTLSTNSKLLKSSCINCDDYL